MPTYDYECQKCGEVFEFFHGMKDSPKEVCPSCNQNSLKKLIGAGAGLIFKGSGFYQTDYRSENYIKAKKEDREKASPTGEKKSVKNTD